MSRTCDISGRTPLSGNRRSHSNIATRRRQNLNLQKITINGRTFKASARAIRTLTKQGQI